MAVGMAIEHRKTTFPLDDAVTPAEVNMCMNDTAMDMHTRRCQKDPFMQYKDGASTVGEPVASVAYVCGGGMPNDQKGRTAKAA